MSPPGMADAGGPRPEQLAAYVDGELDPGARAAVEAWLADHPESAAEVEALRALTALGQAAAPPEPSEAQWAAVLARIEAALPAAAPAGPSRGRRLAGVLAVLSATAAAVVLVMALYRPANVEPPPAGGPLPVVSADDVEIISMHGADERALVIGALPARGHLDLVGPGEATVDQVTSDMQDMDTYDSRDGSTSPMVAMIPREEES